LNISVCNEFLFLALAVIDHRAGVIDHRRRRVTALFKLIELPLGHQNWSPKEPVLAALAVPVDRLANLFSADCHETAAGFGKVVIDYGP